MSIPLLKVTPKTQNQRVEGYDVPDEDDPTLYRLSHAISDTDVNEIIWAAYRQIFSEHLVLESYRQPALESQLRNRAISVREFIRGLGKSDVYRDEIADLNSNYRIVDLTFKRFLGRASYSKDEQIAWSIVIATKGLHGFIDAVVDSDEYRQNFGDDVVPYQRRRMEGRPFNLTNPRYSDYWRNRMLEMELQTRSYYQVRQYQSGNLDRKVIRQAVSPMFFNMAQSLLIPQQDSQRDVARATSSTIKVPDSSRSAGEVKPTVKATNVALPYRYLYNMPKV
ncbi:phycobilisome rod-core linker polypeptide [Leptolyngbya sp. FACHB-711]|uniref:phycobilisome rod-core linker polypeptide n=1 Tax=unclassified Leptolyngbya TaxID=2650499 RepID=UPI0016825018|nr:phycobilisome rod-core linker polypeptide [Leptolyngbya sp. FACHB-711]MBD1850765.1 phycobilisome rod-core linker polypeptide [Cyanobacteria bacterium FACHB-502]MBD2024099.1 phycobilisome rod-core linker polypeptide [Leptolyngbya sp. FACHB-711]